MAGKYPSAEIRGIDLAAIQPANRPANCVFHPYKDFESPWMLGEESFDLIHMRLGCGSVSDWGNIYRQAYRHLRPGGYLELVEIDFEPRIHKADPNFMNSQLYAWYNVLKEATADVSKPIAYNRNTRLILEAAGFEVAGHEWTELPLNDWPHDPQLKDVGKWYNLAFEDSVVPLLLGPMTRVKGWSFGEVQALADAANRAASDKTKQPYNMLHVITARKPEW
jgi:SAM-dependent methyltransferase